MEQYLSVKNVAKYFGKFQALNNINFDVNEGEFVCILGPSGCGKTTLLRVIAGLESQSEGTIQQNNNDISLLPPDPNKDGYVLGTKKLGLKPSDILVIEDSDVGIEAALKAKVQKVLRHTDHDKNLPKKIKFRIPKLMGYKEFNKFFSN